MKNTWLQIVSNRVNLYACLTNVSVQGTSLLRIGSVAAQVYRRISLFWTGCFTKDIDCSYKSTSTCSSVTPCSNYFTPQEEEVVIEKVCSKDTIDTDPDTCLKVCEHYSCKLTFFSLLILNLCGLSQNSNLRSLCPYNHSFNNRLFHWWTVLWTHLSWLWLI